MKKYCGVNTAVGIVRFRKKQSAEIERVFNSSDSCVLLSQQSAVG